MLERTGWGASRHGGRARTKAAGGRRPGFDPLEARALMAASLATLPAITVPAGIGYQVPLNGSGSTSTTQTFTVTSSNPDIKATVAQGDFLTINVTHTTSTPSNPSSDPSFSGSLTFQLFNDVAPTAVARIEQLVTSGFYTNTSFYRITPISTSTDIIAQGGANGNVTNLPKTGFPFQNEFVQSVAFTNPGQLALANAGFTNNNGINTSDYFSNSSEFFVTSTATRFLDFGYTIFGQLVAQSDPNLLNEIDHVAVTTNPNSGEKSQPVTPVTITSASLSNINPNGVVHIDTTTATAGETANVSVTAFDPTTNTTKVQSFIATVGPTDPFNPTTNTGPAFEKPFLATFPSITPQSIQVAQGQPAVFQVQGVSAGGPSDPLTYTVAGSTSATATGLGFNPIPSSEATASVSASGVVTVTPVAGFTGNITVLVGVRDQIDRSGKGLSDVSNYDVKQFTINVTNSTTPVAHAPIAQPVTVAVSSGAPQTVQLAGISATTGTSQGLTYAIVAQPAHGTLTNLNATTGTVTYTPAANFLGSDSFTYDVTDTTTTPNLTSTPATVTVNVASGVTGAVRLITNTTTGDNVLVVTPPPNKTRHQNQVAISETTGSSPTIQVEVNGVIDSTQPVASSLTEIVVYGAKTGTSVVVAPNVDVPVSADGGHGGTNFLNLAGSADTTIRAWFGHNAVQGGSANNLIVGRKGRLARVVKSPGTDTVFLSGIDPYNRVPHFKVASFHGKTQDIGAFYKFVGNRLVKTNQPASVPFRQNKDT